MSQPKIRIAYLDGIRGLAVLLVMLHHFTVIEPRSAAEWYLVHLSRFGAQGVDLFFVLSGLLITGILVDTRNNAHYFRDFYVRRALRIVPIFYLLVAFRFLTLPALASFSSQLGPTSTGTWWWYPTFLSNFLIAKLGEFPRHEFLSPSWSLSIEEQYYFLWAAVAFLASTKTLKRICVAIIVLSPLVRALCLHAGLNPTQVYVLTFCRLDGLAWGGLLALWKRSDSDTIEQITRRAGPAAFLAAGVTIGPALLGTWDQIGPVILVAGYSAVNLLFAAMIWLAFQNRCALRRIFENRVLQFFGFYSYAIYLLHIPLRGILRDHFFGDAQFRALPVPPLIGQLAFYIGATLIVVPCVYLSWIVIERPFLRLKERLTAAT